MFEQYKQANKQSALFIAFGILFVLSFAMTFMLFVRMNRIERLIAGLETVNNDEALVIAPSVTGFEKKIPVYGENVDLSEQEAEIIINNNENVSVSTEEFDGAENSEHRVYLTFDDGPSSNTEEILKVLNEYNVKATFFVNGKRSDELRFLITKISEEGHTVAMHSFSHKYSEVYSSVESFSDDMKEIEHLIYAQTGKHPKLYRFPGGSSNSVSRGRITQFIDVLKEDGIEYVDWNISSGDATGTTSLKPEVIAQNVLDGYKKNMYNTSVVLLHDSDLRSSTVEALPDIIKGLRDEGAVLLPITEDTPAVHHIDN